jgi:hypothetical protein
LTTRPGEALRVPFRAGVAALAVLAVVVLSGLAGCGGPSPVSQTPASQDYDAHPENNRGDGGGGM